MARFTEDGVQLDIGFKVKSRDLNDAKTTIEKTLSDASKTFDASDISKAVGRQSKSFKQSFGSAFKDAFSSAFKDSRMEKVSYKAGKKVAQEYKRAFNETLSGGNLDAFSLDYYKSLRNSGVGQDRATKGQEAFVRGVKDSNSYMAQFQDSFGVTEKKASGLGKVLSGFGAVAKKGFGGIINVSKKLGNGFKSLFNRARSGAQSAGLGIKRLGMAVLGGASAYMILRKALQFAREGFNNLSQVSSTTRQNTQNLQASLLYLKNALGAVIAPIYNVIAPALSKMVDMFASAINTVAKFIGAITGKSTVYVAKKSFAGITDGASSAGSALGGASEKAEELKRQLMGFDQIEKLDDVTKDLGSGGSGGGSGGGGGADYGSMFEEVSTEKDGVFKDFFKPFEDAWNKKGKGVIDAVKNALEGTKSVAKAVGDSFWAVWTNGTGEETIEHVLGIVTGILNTWGNLAEAFKKGWTTGDVGTSIIQGLWDILNKVLGMINKISNATAEWAKNLDFTPILNAFNKLLTAVNPVVDKITNGLAWAYTNVLLPLGKWTIESALPAVIDTLSKAFGALDSALEAAKPVFDWIWSNFLKPLAEWTGGVIVGTIGLIGDAFEGLQKVFDGLKNAIEKVKEWVDKLKKALGMDEEEKQTVQDFNNKTADLYTGQSEGDGYYTPDGLWVSTAPKTQKVTIDAQYSSGSKERVDNTNNVNGTKTASITAKLKEGLSIINDVNLTDGEKQAKIKALFESGSKDIVNSTNGMAGTKKVGINAQYNSDYIKNRVNAVNGMKGTKKVGINAQYNSDYIRSRVNAVNGMAGTKKVGINAQYGSDYIRQRVNAVNGMAGTKRVGINAQYNSDNIRQRVNSVNGMAGTKKTYIKAEYYNQSSRTRVNNANNVSGTKKLTINAVVTGLTSKLKQFFGLAKGGAFYGGKWHGIPQYARGGYPTHGTQFIAGEKGPEVVGHVGGRTEVLNASQLASAVASGVGSAFSRLTIRMPNPAPQLRFLATQQQAVAHQQEQNTQGVMNILVQILTAIKEIDTDTYIDGDKITNTIVKNINRRTRLTGVSELIY